MDYNAMIRHLLDTGIGCQRLMQTHDGWLIVTVNNPCVALTASGFRVLDGREQVIGRGDARVPGYWTWFKEEA